MNLLKILSKEEFKREILELETSVREKKRQFELLWKENYDLPPKKFKMTLFNDQSTEMLTDDTKDEFKRWGLNKNYDSWNSSDGLLKNEQFHLLSKDEQDFYIMQQIVGQEADSKAKKWYRTYWRFGMEDTKKCLGIGETRMRSL